MSSSEMATELIDVECYDFHEECTAEEIDPLMRSPRASTEIGELIMPVAEVPLVPIVVGALQSPPPVRLPTTAIQQLVEPPAQPEGRVRVQSKVLEALDRFQDRERKRARNSRLFSAAVALTAAAVILSLLT